MAEPDSQLPASLSTVGGSSLGRARFLHPLSFYERIYATSARGIKKWVSRGKAAVPPELPPLDEPGRMADWWRAHCKQRVPAKLMILAVQDARANPNNGLPEPSAGIDVKQLDIANLDSLRNARLYSVALDRKLAAAYAAGLDHDIIKWQPAFEKALESVRRLEIAERAAARQSGDLTSRAEVSADLSQLLEIQRMMRQTMSKRIRARLPGLPGEWSDKLDEAIELERSREESVLRRLKQFNSVEEIRFELEAA